ncbi:hypothetical protein ACWD0J_26980 [Streptomyces sp. NPDC003011]
MGWAGGNAAFERVARKLIELDVDDTTKTEVCGVLIDGLRDCGWDTVDESLGEFADDSAIVAAFRRHGFVITCGDEHPTKPWSCEIERHHPDDHKDDQGHTWPRATPPAATDSDSPVGAA